jgi:hypothetical protein
MPTSVAITLKMIIHADAERIEVVINLCAVRPQVARDVAQALVAEIDILIFEFG